jgi:hypothetical protein
VDKIEASEAFMRLVTDRRRAGAHQSRSPAAGEIDGLLGSEHDGEQRAAAREIEKLRRKRGLSWAEIFGVGDTRPARRRRSDLEI